MMSFTGRDGRSLRVDQEVIPVNYLSDIDANWRFTDAAGHEHHCEYDAAEHWPTLRKVADSTWWCGDCEDEHEDAHLECHLCGEHVQPGRTVPGTKLLSGALSYFIDGQPVSKEQAQEFTEQLRRQAQ